MSQPTTAAASTSGFAYRSYDPPRAGGGSSGNNARKKRNRNQNKEASRTAAASNHDDNADNSTPSSATFQAWQMSSSAKPSSKSPSIDSDRLLGILEGRQRTLMEQSKTWAHWQGETLTDLGWEASSRPFFRADEWERATQILLGIGSSKSAPTSLDDALNNLSIQPESARTCILCLGLGKINESRESQFQFAYLRMMVDHLNVRREDVLVYDPMFQRLDVQLVGREGWKLLPSNEVRRVACDTIQR